MKKYKDKLFSWLGKLAESILEKRRMARPGFLQPWKGWRPTGPFQFVANASYFF